MSAEKKNGARMGNILLGSYCHSHQVRKGSSNEKISEFELAAAEEDFGKNYHFRVSPRERERERSSS